MDNNKETEKKEFYYTLKLRTALIGLIFFLLLSSPTGYKVLNLIIGAMINNLEIINELYNNNNELLLVNVDDKNNINNIVRENDFC